MNHAPIAHGASISSLKVINYNIGLLESHVLPELLYEGTE